MQVSRLFVCVVVALCAAMGHAEDDRLVFAHRGASGYLPEHTLAAYAVAHAMGADYVEPDVVCTADGVLICLHDLTLEDTTDVELRFPARARADGKWYAIDFTLEEVKSLGVTGRGDEVAPGHRIVTFDEMLGLVQTLNAERGCQIGVIPEPKQPDFHEDAGQPIIQPIVETLGRFGYSTRTDLAIVQCFDVDALEAMRASGCDLRLVFLSGDPIDDATLSRVARTCDGIGPSRKLIEDDGTPIDGGSLVRRAHALGLTVYPWTFGHDTDMNAHFVESYGVDGFLTDYPDLGRHVVDAFSRSGAAPLAREPACPPADDVRLLAEQSISDIGAGQGVALHDGFVYLYGDADTGVIREYALPRERSSPRQHRAVDPSDARRRGHHPASDRPDAQSRVWHLPRRHGAPAGRDLEDRLGSCARWGHA